MTIKVRIREYLENDLGVNVSSIKDDDLLFTSGLIDSFALIELLSFLESEFSCKIDIAQLSLDDLDTIEALSAIAQ